MRRICLLMLLLSVSAAPFAQTKRVNKQKEATQDLLRSLEEGRPDSELAKDYEKLARELITNQAYAEAEENLIKAKNIYTRLKMNRETARIERELSMLQKRQTKIEPADSPAKADSSLTDAQILQISEEKIRWLEQERTLKDELLRRKSAFNNILITVTTMILVLLFFMIRAWLSIRVKNKRIALQSLRREMNPHFIFNSLNSVNQFIAQNNELEANKYLSSYSKLMRTVMENSNKDFIPLSVELEQMRQYLQLEYMRFADKFTYEIEVDDALDADAVYIPNMLIQPQLENAIWHGLRYKESKGHLLLKISKEKTHIAVWISDNGIGIQKSEEWKTPKQKEHKSRGLTNTYERIELLNKLYRTKIKLTIKEKEGEETGVIVKFEIPHASVETQRV